MSAALGAVFAAMLAAHAWAASPRVPCDDLRRAQLLKEPGLVVVDVRPAEDYIRGHIQGARNIPAAEAGSARLPRQGRLVVYCSENACPLAQSASAKLAELGHDNVLVLDGGFNEWLKRGYPAREGAGEAAPSRMMSAAQARERLAAGKLTACDVRPALKFSAGHIPGAVNMPLEELGAGLGDIERAKPVLVYDLAAPRMHAAAGKLREAGFEVFELAGGLAGWVSRKYPLEVR